MLQATIGFVNALGMFDYDYYATQNNTYTGYTVRSLGEYEEEAKNPTPGSYVRMAVDFSLSSVVMVAKILFSVVLILPTLITVFEIPTALAVFLQGIVYFVYVLGWAQWQTGKSMAGYI